MMQLTKISAQLHTRPLMDDAVSFIQALGAGCLLAKLNLREAYRAVPIHPQDRPLLAMQWE